VARVSESGRNKEHIRELEEAMSRPKKKESKIEKDIGRREKSMFDREREWAHVREKQHVAERKLYLVT